MSFDLLLDLDDELVARLRAEARLEGRSMEERVRGRILKGANHAYPPLTEADRFVMRPMVRLDLTS